LDGDLLAWADRYAEERRWTRTTVFEAALEALRGDAKGGVPDPPRAPELEEKPVPNPPAPPRVPEFSPAPDFGPLVRRGSEVFKKDPRADEELRRWKREQGRRG
jgi:hypothetical protein